MRSIISLENPPITEVTTIKAITPTAMPPMASKIIFRLRRYRQARNILYMLISYNIFMKSKEIFVDRM